MTQLTLPLDYAPDEVRAHGLRDAHPYPLVSLGKDDNGGLWSFRVPARFAWDYPSLELRAGNNWPALVFDIDQPDALDRIRHATIDIPHPNWVVERTTNGHGHAVYTLGTPVHRGRNARERPLQLAARVSEWYAAELGADAGYAGVLTHNPAPPDAVAEQHHLHTIWGRQEPYELRTLAEPIPRGWRRPHLLRTAIGRNCTLFEAAMRWAGSEQNLDHDVLPFLEAANAQRFEHHPAGLLPASEVRGIARSVERYRARWRAQGRFYAPDERAAWGRARGKASGRVRRQRNAERDAAILAGHLAGASLRTLAAAHGLSHEGIRYVLQRELSVALSRSGK